MKTIEERASEYEQRADNYVGHPEEMDEFSSATIKRQAFIDGAKTQKDLDEEYNGKSILYAVNKTAERTKKEIIHKACLWLEARSEYQFTDNFISSFKEYLENEN